ncbi:MAG: hypothetical protein Q8R30_01100 [bacterium]|nr:hypothetical protein [bacterium]
MSFPRHAGGRSAFGGKAGIHPLARKRRLDSRLRSPRPPRRDESRLG